MQHLIGFVLSSILFFSCVLTSCTSTDTATLSEMGTSNLKLLAGKQSALPEDFTAFLSSFPSSRSNVILSPDTTKRSPIPSDSTVWDFENIMVVHDENTGLNMQAVSLKNSANLTCGVFYLDDEVNSEIFMVQETARNNYSLYDDSGNQLLEFKYSPATQILTCMTSVCGPRVRAVLCGVAMETLGWEISYLFIVPSGGSSLGFGVLWSIVSSCYCY